MHDGVKLKSESEVLLDAGDYFTNGTPYSHLRDRRRRLVCDLSSI